MLRIGVAVGKGAHNRQSDVKIVQALMNAYLRYRSDTPLSINGQNDGNLEAAINCFQADYMKLGSTADSRVDPSGKTFKEVGRFLSEKVFKPVAISPPSFGVVTWEAEGMEGGKYHSRKLHVPSSTSGLTIGRGYDCRRKTKEKIKKDLLATCFDAKTAETLSKAAGLYGNNAKWFVINNDLIDFQVAPDQQKSLFSISYDEEEAEVIRICGKSDVVKAYGETDWECLDSAIKDVTVDLKFRGDYTGASRRLIQKHISDNDLKAFKGKLSKDSNWPGVPPDRFRRRVDFLNKAV